MIVCVTGATGFIGKKLCLVLLAAGHEVRALGRNASNRVSDRVRYFCGDITSGSGELAGFFESVDVVFHCAGEVSNTDRMLSLHVDGTLNLLCSIQREFEFSGKKIHWVQLSSVGAYGLTSAIPSAKRLVDASSDEYPENIYEITKTASDHLVSNFSKQCSYFTSSIVRPSIVVGDTMPNQSFFQLARAVRARLFFYVGEKGAVANYVHVDDVVDALVVCGFNSNAKGGIYVVSNDCFLEDVIYAIAKFYGVTRPWIRLPEVFVRAVTFVFSKAKRFPLTQSRVDALVKRTLYKSNMCEPEIGFSYKRAIPDSIASILREHG